MRKSSIDDLDDQLVSYASSLWKSEWADSNDLCGELNKQGKATYYKRWQRRWIVLKNDSLFYFKSRQDPHPAGVLFLDSSTLVEDVSKQLSTEFCIGITVNSSCSMESSRAFQRRSYYFMADTRLEFDTWINALRHAALGSSTPLGGNVDGNQLSISQPLPNADHLLNRHLGIARNSASIRSISFDSGSATSLPPPLSHSNGTSSSAASNRLHASSSLSTCAFTRKHSTSSAFLENDDFSFSAFEQPPAIVPPPPPLLEPLAKRNLTASLPPAAPEPSAKQPIQLETDHPPRKQSISLFDIFVEVYQHVNDYSLMVQSTLSNPRDAPPVNYLEPGTAVVRNVRHLLYFIDGKFAKSMQNSDFSACLGRHMSVVIERSRKIGYHAKHLTEEECIGLKSPALVRELIVQLDELLRELQIFVMIAKNLSFIDQTTHKKCELFMEFSAFPVAKNCLQELLAGCGQMAKAINGHDKEHYSHISANLAGLVNVFCHALQQHFSALYQHHAKIAQAALAVNKMVLEEGEMKELPKTMDRLRSELKQTTEKASDLWPPPNAEITMTEKYFSLAVLLVRAIVTLLTVSRDASFEEVSQFWVTYQLGATAQSDSRSYSASFANKPFMRWINTSRSSADASAAALHNGEFPPSPVDRILEEDVDREFAGTDEAVSEILAYPSPLLGDGKRISRLTSQLASAKLNDSLNDDYRQQTHSRSSPPPVPEKDEQRSPVPSNNNKQELYINEIVASTIKELVSIILETSKSLAELLIMESRRLATAAVLERIGQLSTAVVTACSQTEEELGALESQNIPNNLSNALDDARQALSRSCSCFEISIKNLTGFFAPPDASKSVLKDIVSLEKACKLMTNTVNDLINYQAKAAIKAQKKRLAGDGQQQTVIGFALGSAGGVLPPPSPPTTPLEPKISDFKKMVDEKVVDDILEHERQLFENSSDIMFKKFEDGRAPLVKAGTLEMLVEKLTYHKLPSSEYTSAFLLTYRSFTSAERLLELLKQRYNTKITDANISESQRKIYMTKKIVPIRLRVLNVLKMWVKNNYEDFASNAELLQSLHDFLPVMREDFKNGLKDFEMLLERKAKGQQTNILSTATAHVGRPPVPMIPKATTLISLLDIDPLEIARQLTLLQWKIFYAIEPNECLDQAWNSKKLHHRSPHIRQMIQFSNFIVQWVGTEAVQGMMPKNRALLIKHWVTVAEKLKSLNNFDGLKSVLCGLHSSAITRMKKTWELVPTKTKVLLDEMSQLMSEEKSCKNYRQLLHSINPPCIPFLGVYLTDLTMIESGNPDNLKECPNLINFQKRYLVAQVINELRRYQCTPYNLTVVDSIACWIKERPVQDSQEIYDTSLALEPRQAPSALSLHASYSLPGFSQSVSRQSSPTPSASVSTRTGASEDTVTVDDSGPSSLFRRKSLNSASMKRPSSFSTLLLR